MRRIAFQTISAALFVALGAGIGFAQSDPIAQRKALMKEVGGATGRVAAILKGEAPFSADTANASLDVYIRAAKEMPKLYPDTSKTGGDTSASPKVWEDKAGFDAAFAKFGADAEAAKAKIKDLDTLRVAFGDVSKNCGACHQVYRVQRN